MRKWNVLVFFGGCSSEYEVSLESAYAVIENLDRANYCPIPVGITMDGRWFYFQGDTKKIKDNTWANEKDSIPAMLSTERVDHRLLLFPQPDGPSRSIPVDVALPIIHGKNGEDGTLQGLLELFGIPLAGCNTLSSALCMDKDRAHKLAALAGVRVPRSMTLNANDPIAHALSFALEIGFPLYVKPVRSGSSYGITRVEKLEELSDAVALAFHYDSQVILEENIAGFEVGCAVLGTQELITGELDEIELSEGFFNYTEKYTLKTSAIHVPARIDRDLSARLKETAKVIYRALGCSVFARVDMFLTPQGEIVFNEVNTIPGFTEHSRYPGMMKAAGYSFSQVLDRIIRLAVRS
ncbi:MAG: D-alanine--D-serine ligase VanG [Lachnospiraceae bacterium]|jgi:D-alanine---D-serine ligase|nr:D-alanine--D-serine ligase VanG [Lachnospiraceae bacterium]